MASVEVRSARGEEQQWTGEVLRFAEAAIDYQYALKLDPNLSAPLYGLAEAYRGMNRVDDARTFIAGCDAIFRELLRATRMVEP